MKQILRPAIVLFAVLTVLTGLCYPLAITALAQLFFPHEANGSLITRNGQLIGSQLIGQAFSEPRYFWSRPSATSLMSNNASNSGGANQGPTNPALVEAVKARIAALHSAGPVPMGWVPVDLVTASASGLDPDISPAAAYYQVPRVAAIRKLPEEKVRALVEHEVILPQWGFLGAPRVNVLQLNLALDRL